MQSQAALPMFIQRYPQILAREAVALFVGVVLMSLLAQVSIPLPWTPVPITGQTLGVALVALSWGRKRAVAVMISYLAVGAVGLPVFALGKSGLSVGPTMGYLVGMIFASFIVGFLADKGFTKSFWRSLLGAYVGSVFIFGFGLLGLSFFVPSEHLLVAGLLPFLPGDLIKNLIAAAASSSVRKTQK